MHSINDYIDIVISDETDHNGMHSTLFQLKILKLSPVCQSAIITLEKTVDDFGEDNLESVYQAVNEAFFELASDVIRPYSQILADRMEKGA